MGADGYFEHNSHDGTAFWKRIERWYGSGGYGYWSVGENLLWSSPDVEPAGALELWMDSPEHRANILTARVARDRYLGRARRSAAPGTLQRPRRSRSSPPISASAASRAEPRATLRRTRP